MSWSLAFTERYNRRAARFLKRHPERRDIYRKTLLLLEANPHHPTLRLHAEAWIDDQRLIPIDIGSHDVVDR